MLFLLQAVYSSSMGRNLPSTTQMVFDQIAELRPFYDALRHSDQLILDKFFEAILQQRAAIGNAAGLLPMEIMPWVILLEERKRNDYLDHELFGAIQELESRLRKLEQPADGKKNAPPRVRGHPEQRDFYKGFNF